MTETTAASLFDERETKLEEVKAQAYLADQSTEDQLYELAQLMAARRKDPTIESRYEVLRNTLAAQILEEGPRYFVDDDGHKRYAWAVQPEPIQIDMSELTELFESGKLTYEQYEEAAPRKADKTAIRRFVANQTIETEDLIKIASLSKGTAFVRISDPVINEDDDD